MNLLKLLIITLKLFKLLKINQLKLLTDEKLKRLKKKKKNQLKKLINEKFQEHHGEPQYYQTEQKNTMTAHVIRFILKNIMMKKGRQ